MGKYLSPRTLVRNQEEYMKFLEEKRKESKQITEMHEAGKINFQFAMHQQDKIMTEIKNKYMSLFSVVINV